MDQSVKKILIIQTAFIGDTILASHFARALKDLYPNSEIHEIQRNLELIPNYKISDLGN